MKYIRRFNESSSIQAKLCDDVRKSLCDMCDTYNLSIQEVLPGWYDGEDFKEYISKDTDRCIRVMMEKNNSPRNYNRIPYLNTPDFDESVGVVCETLNRDHEDLDFTCIQDNWSNTIILLFIIEVK